MQKKNSRKPKIELWSIMPIVQGQEYQERPRGKINTECSQCEKSQNSVGLCRPKEESVFKR